MYVIRKKCMFCSPDLNGNVKNFECYKEKEIDIKTKNFMKNAQ